MQKKNFISSHAKRIAIGLGCALVVFFMLSCMFYIRNSVLRQHNLSSNSMLGFGRNCEGIEVVGVESPERMKIFESCLEDSFNKRKLSCPQSNILCNQLDNSATREEVQECIDELSLDSLTSLTLLSKRPKLPAGSWRQSNENKASTLLDEEPLLPERCCSDIIIISPLPNEIRMAKCVQSKHVTFWNGNNKHLIDFVLTPHHHLDKEELNEYKTFRFERFQFPQDTWKTTLESLGDFDKLSFNECKFTIGIFSVLQPYYQDKRIEFYNCTHYSEGETEANILDQ